MEKSWLKLFATINQDIDLAKLHLEYLNESKSRIEYNLGSNCDKHLFLNRLEAVNKEISRAEEDYAELKLKKQEIYNWLKDRSTLESKIILHYYRDKLTLEEVAYKLNYSVDRIKHIHAALVKDLK